MSSRIEQKARLKAERLAAERKAEEAAARKRLVKIIGGAVGAVAAAVLVVLALTGGANGVKLPAAKIKDLKLAAVAAGCTARSYPIEGSMHVATPVTYKTNPPTSGNHNPNPASDGIYGAANTPAPVNFVHSLEHGRIEYQYRPGTSAAQVKQLEALLNESVQGTPGYHQLLFQNSTGMPFAVAATAWGQLIGCPTLNLKTFDALRDFRDAYIDKGPEQVP